MNSKKKKEFDLLTNFTFSFIPGLILGIIFSVIVVLYSTARPYACIVGHVSCVLTVLVCVCVFMSNLWFETIKQGVSVRVCDMSTVEKTKTKKKKHDIFSKYTTP